MVAPAAFGAASADEALLKAYQRSTPATRWRWRATRRRSRQLARTIRGVLGGRAPARRQIRRRRARLPVKRAGTYLAGALRADWAKQLGKREDWASFERALALLAARDLDCAVTPGPRGWPAASHGRGRGEVMWVEPGGLPEGCALLADRLAARGAIIQATSGSARGCCSSAARSPPPRARSVTFRPGRPRMKSCSPRRRLSRSACWRGCRRILRGAPRARWRCSRRCGWRARIRASRPRRSRGRSAEG